MIVSLNGVLIDDQETKISIYDRGFTLGDGIFETVRARNKKPLFLDSHMQRLRKSAAFLKIALNTTNKEVYKITTELMNANKLDNAIIRITLSRGKSARGLATPLHQDPTLLLTSAQLTTTQTPIHVIVSQKTRRNEYSPLSRLKSLCYLDNIIARQEAEERNTDDALLMNTQDRIAESTISNLFIINDGKLITPPESDGALPGITRQRLIEEYNVIEQGITIKNLMNSTEAFLTNSLGIRPLASVEGNPIGSGYVGQKTQLIMKYFHST